MTSSEQPSDSLPPLLQKAIAHHEAGCFVEAEEAYRAVLKKKPQHTKANYNLGVLALQLEQPAAAEPFFFAALQSAPELEQSWLACIEVKLQQRHLPEARVLLEQALEVFGTTSDLQAANERLALLEAEQQAPEPQDLDRLAALFHSGRYDETKQLAQQLIETFADHPFAWRVLGVVLEKQGLLTEALSAMTRAVELQPNDATNCFNLGNLCKKLKQLAEAEIWYRQALALCPDALAVHANLAATLMGLGRPEEAEVSYRRALELNPLNAESWDGLGALLLVLKRYAEAEDCLHQALAIHPTYAKAHHDLGMLQEALERREDAENSYRKAVELDPQLVEAQLSLGGLLIKRRALDEALSCYSEALKKNANQPDVLAGLGELLFEKRRLEDAEWSLRLALELNPELLSVKTLLGGVIGLQGRTKEAEGYFSAVLDIQPDNLNALQNLIFCMTHDPNLSKAELLRAHRKFGEMVEGRDFKGPDHKNLRDPDRRLRIGFVSADFRQHPVSYFIEPVLRSMDRSAFELFAYNTHRFSVDEVGARLKGYFDVWRDVSDLEDEALASQIREDTIDILFDLAGHTGGNRLSMFALKPAPVQASWIGYPATTGLQAMDYYLMDSGFATPGMLDDQFTERLVYLPAAWAFEPYADSPPISDLPALSSGFFTFGSFNRVNKLNEATIRLWCRVLNAVPQAKMLVGGFTGPESVRRVLSLFEDNGISHERLICKPSAPMPTYLAFHHQVDLLLDSIPFSGGTVTNHALWMGVPTLTLAGETLPGRLGVALMGQVGLEGFIAESETEYVALARDWSEKPKELAKIRSGMRQRIEHSALRSAEGITRDVERALRIMWRRYCNAEGPISFSVTRQ